MCAQCMATAAAAVGAASGIRAYLGARRPAWIGPERLRRLTVVLVAAALIASATLVSGTG
jgi:hypothetical protein